MRRIAANLALLFTAILITCWILDLVLALRPPTSYLERRDALRREAARRAGYAFDPRSQSEVARDLRAAGRDAWPAVSALNVSQRSPDLVDSLFPLAGIAAVETVLCGELGRHVLYRADRYGFRNPDAAWQSPAVVLIGDSFTAGMCVDEPLAPRAQLGASGVRALAVAYRGASPVFELALLREYVAALEPPLVVWIYYEGNDLDELNERHPGILSRYHSSAYRQGLADRQDEVDSLLRTWVLREEARRNAVPAPERASWTGTAIKTLKLWHLRQLARGIATRRTASASPNVALFAQALGAARDDVRSWGGTMRFVYLPAPHAFGRRGLEDVLGVHVYDSVRTIACRLGLPLLDLRERMTARPDAEDLYPAPAFDGMHFSELGYRVFGTELVAFVRGGGDDCPRS